MAIGCSISLPGMDPATTQRDKGQRGGQGRHQDRRQAFACTADHKRRAEGLALLVLQVLEMTDQQNAVAGRDSEYREEPDQRPEREHTIARARRPARRRPVPTAV